MSMFRRTGAIALSALVVSAFLVLPSPASAETVQTRPESFIATANARALDLELLGIKVTVGASGIEMNSAPAAKATGGGVLLAPGTVSTVQTTGASQALAPPKACVLNLPLPASSTCSWPAVRPRSTAPPAPPRPSAQGSVAAIDVGGQQVLALLAPVLDALAPLLDQVLGTVTGALTPIVGNLLGGLVGGAGLDLNAPVSSLVDIINNATNLATINARQLHLPGPHRDRARSAPSPPPRAARSTSCPASPSAALPCCRSSSARPRPPRCSTGPAAPAPPASTPPSSPSSSACRSSVASPRSRSSWARPSPCWPAPRSSPPSPSAPAPPPRTPTAASSSVADGVSIHLLKGISGGIKLELAHAESGIGGQSQLVEQQKIVEPVDAAGQDRQRPLGPDGGLRPPAGRLHHPPAGPRPAQWQPQPRRPLGAHLTPDPPAAPVPSRCIRIELNLIGRGACS